MLTIYKASAGSGKTYTLAYEYVKLLLGVKPQGQQSYILNSPKYLGSDTSSARHRHILAITFTNKATEEMKSRIIKELGILAADHSDGSDDSNYAEGLIKEFGCSREELREVADKSLRSLLFDYHHFNVSTIDSFFQTVLRAFAREVDRQGDYGIELNDKFAVASGISMMLDDLNYGNPPKRNEILRWIRNYTMELIESGEDSSFFNRSGRLLSQLVEYVTQMSSEHFKREADNVIEYLKDPSRLRKFVRELDSHLSQLDADMKARTRSLIDSILAHGISPDDMKTPLPRMINTVLDSAFGLSLNDYKKSVTLNKIIDSDSPVDATLIFKKSAAASASSQLSDDIALWLKDCRSALLENDSLKRVRAACPGLEFLGFTWDYIKRFRDENNLILLSDTHDLLHRIIAGSETPFIYERIGVTLSHFLIDEFQDTSVLQWSNLKPLVADSVAYDNDNLIIGDEKQAIYRFRNSDSSLLHHVIANEDFPDNHVIRGNQPSENTNYRSAPDIVRFNNALFTRIASQLGVEGYENTVQSLSKGNSSLTSCIRIYNTNKMTVNDMPAEFEITAREILRQHDAGYRWRDIAILVRKRKEARRVVEYMLKYHPEIKILSAEGLLLKNSQAIKLIIGMLKLVDKSYESGDLKDEVKALRPVYGSVGDIRMMIGRYDYFMSENLDPAEALRLALLDSGSDNDGISDSISEIRKVNPSGLVSLVETIIEKKISPERRAADFAFIAAFQDEVLNFCEKYNPSVHAFLQWWDENSDRLAINPGAGEDAVTIMTVHSAKGLEWDCVHIPLGDWSLFKNDQNIWLKPDAVDFVSPDLRPPLLSVTLGPSCLLDGSPLQNEATANRRDQIADNLNTTYVAYTRAGRELNICFSKQIAAGKEVVSALSMPLSDNPHLHMDLKSYILPDVGADGLMFEFGEPTTPKQVTESQQPVSELSIDDYRVFFREDTANLTTIDDATSGLGEIMTDDEVVAEDEAVQLGLFDDTRAVAAERGTHLHSIMADIVTVDDIDAVVSRAAMRYGLTDEDRRSYHDIVSNAFAGARRHVSRWFSPEATVYKEQSIYLPERDSTFRPDRIVVSPDGDVEVVDYKFTAEPLPSHRRQVEVYIALLRAMGFNSVKGYLWYPELNIVKQVK